MESDFWLTWLQIACEHQPLTRSAAVAEATRRFSPPVAYGQPPARRSPTWTVRVARPRNSPPTGSRAARAKGGRPRNVRSTGRAPAAPREPGVPDFERAPEPQSDHPGA